MTGIIFSVTVTLQVAAYPPSSVVAVIVAVPGHNQPVAIAVTFPFWSTEAVDGSLELQITFLLVAFSGKTVAISWAASPSGYSNLSLSNVTPVTGTAFSVTVTKQVAVYPPSLVVTVMVAVPLLTALTFPLWSTVAIDSLLEVQITFLLVAFVGKIVAFSWAVSPSANSNLSLFNVTFVTWTTCWSRCLPQLDNTIGVTTLVDDTPIVKNNIDLIIFGFSFFLPNTAQIR